MTDFSISIIQAPPVFLNLAASMDRAEELIRDAARLGATVVVFPEAWLPGYPVWLDESAGAALWGHRPAELLFRILFANCPVLEGPEIARLADLAAELSVEIVMGIQERRGSSIYNSVVRVTPSGWRDIHRKVMPTHNERLIWAAADGSTLRPWPGTHGPVGALICWEHWMPLARAARHQHGEVLHFALWPAVTELHLLASRHYAFEGQCYVAAAGTVLTRHDVLEGFDSLDTAEPGARLMLEAIPAERELLKSGEAPSSALMPRLSRSPRAGILRRSPPRSIRTSWPKGASISTPRVIIRGPTSSSCLWIRENGRACDSPTETMARV